MGNKFISAAGDHPLLKVVEYKSPTDYLSIDDFYKVYGYACFYNSDTGATDAVQAEELTITLVSSCFPAKLIGHLRKNRGYTVDKEENGIYYVKGDYIPVQIVVTSQLSEKENLWLKSLTNQINGTANAEKLLDAYGKHKNDNLYKAVMNVIVRANKETFQEVKAMCEALRELMKDELDAAMQAGIEKGMQTGIEKGIQKGIQKGMETGLQEGLQRGEETGVKILIENCREFHLSREQTADKIALKYGLSSEKAEEYMKKFWQTR